MSINDFISDITFNLTDWGISYSENATGLTVGTINLEVDESERAAIINNGEELVAITSDADKAAALLAFPLARRAWGCGYTGDFVVTCVNSEVEMALSYMGGDLVISAGIDESGRFTVVEHDLLSQVVCMSDLEAVLASTELAYSSPSEAWQILCQATDLEADHWEQMVEFFNDDATFTHGARLTAVKSSATGATALVKDCGSESLMCVINVEAVAYTTRWSMGDVAAAVLHAIS